MRTGKPVVCSSSITVTQLRRGPTSGYLSTKTLPLINWTSTATSFALVMATSTAGTKADATSHWQQTLLLEAYSTREATVVLLPRRTSRNTTEANGQRSLETVLPAHHRTLTHATSNLTRRDVSWSRTMAACIVSVSPTVVELRYGSPWSATYDRRKSGPLPTTLSITP